MKDLLINAAVSAIIAGLIILFFSGSGGTFGAVSRAPNVDLQVQSITTTADSTFGGGTVTLTTSNTATSTGTIGCVQTYATSTATAIRLVLGSIATSSASYDGVNTVGLVGWRYGTCPNN